MIKKLVSYDKLPSDVLDALHEEYPDGLDDHLFKVSKGNGDFFYAVTCEFNDISYLIKFDVEIDTASFLDYEDEKENEASEFNEKVDIDIETDDEEEEDDDDYKD